MDARTRSEADRSAERNGAGLPLNLAIDCDFYHLYTHVRSDSGYPYSRQIWRVGITALRVALGSNPFLPDGSLPKTISRTTAHTKPSGLH